MIPLVNNLSSLEVPSQPLPTLNRASPEVTPQLIAHINELGCIINEAVTHFPSLHGKELYFSIKPGDSTPASIGGNYNQAEITVTPAFFKLSRESKKFVIAHELAHWEQKQEYYIPFLFSSQHSYICLKSFNCVNPCSPEAKDVVNKFIVLSILVTSILGCITGVVSNDMDVTTKTFIVLAATALPWTQLILKQLGLYCSRKGEYDADKRAVIALGTIDGAIEVFKEEKVLNVVMEWERTHPHYMKRIEAVKQLAKDNSLQDSQIDTSEHS